MRHYFIEIPETLIKSICKQLHLSNPPNLETVETVVLWCVSGSLAGDIFNDTLSEEGSSKKALKKLRWEIRQYFKDLREMENETSEN
jgi:hypothetical protein